MSDYVIGDIHGCSKTLQALLERLPDRSQNERLWLVGDLVNAGPSSREVLLWAKDRDTQVHAVLGNHDLYALARWRGVCKRKSRDTLDELLGSADAVDLLEWLRTRPLLLETAGNLIVHAGFPPDWDYETALELCGEAEQKLRGSKADALLRLLFNDPPKRWRRAMSPVERACWTLSVVTTIRTVHPDGRPCRRFNGPPEEAPGKRIPWYQVKHPSFSGCRIFFGHWAALGFRDLTEVVGLDSGCVWGNSLTAFRLGDGAVFQQTRMD